jgi:hypothetical protein
MPGWTRPGGATQTVRRRRGVGLPRRSQRSQWRVEKWHLLVVVVVAVGGGGRGDEGAVDEGAVDEGEGGEELGVGVAVDDIGGDEKKERDEEMMVVVAVVVMMMMSREGWRRVVAKT